VAGYEVRQFTCLKAVTHRTTNRAQCALIETNVLPPLATVYWLLMLLTLNTQDFWETIVHHLTTVTLMMMSWTANMVRMGTLILCVHDAVDYFLEVRTFAL